VPASVLEQVMPALRSAGIVRSERGAHGGYRLNKPPAEITLERVVRLFQGQLAPIGYATRRNPDPCPDLVARSLRPVWTEVRDATIDILERTTFADLATRAGGPWRDPVMLSWALHRSYVVQPPATCARFSVALVYLCRRHVLRVAMIPEFVECGGP
jgi:Rrf2 family protein